MVIKFDLSSIPTNTKITSATLSLTDTYGNLYGGSAYTVHQINSTWDAETLIFNNKPSEGPSISSGSLNDEIYSFDVTSATQSMIQNPSINFGYMIKAVQNQAQAHFASTETGGPDIPELIIEYDATETVDKKKHNTNPLKIIPHKNSMSLFLPFNGCCNITVYNLKGKEIYNTNATGHNNWHKVSIDLSSSIKVIIVQNGNNIYKTILNNF